jgi:DNA-directed RNA polymerase specialized sigma24 family protein
MHKSIGMRLIHDDVDAWTQVYEEVFPRAREIIHRKFGPDKRWWSADDAVASACRTTYRRLKEGLSGHDLNSWEDLRRLIVAVASNKIIDCIRKAEVEGKWADRARADASEITDGKASAVLNDLFAAESDRAMREALQNLENDLEDAAERIVFRGKLEKLDEKRIASKVHSETGEAMTVYMVREIWRTIRARLNRRFPELREGSAER